MKQALSNIRVLDLSRVLAGPVCTQILGDLGADIIKVERPGEGDDTRKWGPPYLKDAHGKDTTESAYYLSANRNKRSIAVDITTSDGQEIIHGLLEKCDVLIENFKCGGLKKYGLDYESVHARHPHIIYASITGYGQNGPLSPEPGYDFIAQAMSGFMASTGEIDGEPMKAGVAISDVMTGLYAAIGILSALHSRGETGKGQHVDVALLDVTIAAMTNLAQYYLTSGKVAPRQGNAHSTITPYQCYKSKDGYVVVAVGNDTQFARFAKGLGHPEWPQNPAYTKNTDRVKNKAELSKIIQDILITQNTDHWVNILRDLDVPVGPVNDMAGAFAMDQVKARNMRIEMMHPLNPEPISLVGSPLKMSETPVSYRLPPPEAGQQTAQILREYLDMDTRQIEALIELGVVE